MGVAGDDLIDPDQIGHQRGCPHAEPCRPVPSCPSSFPPQQKTPSAARAQEKSRPSASSSAPASPATSAADGDEPGPDDARPS